MITNVDFRTSSSTTIKFIFCHKIFNFFREVFVSDGILVKEEEHLSVEIKPGWKEGTKITYPKKGDVYPGRIPADIVFLIKEEKHKLFQRDGSTLRFFFNFSEIIFSI